MFYAIVMKCRKCDECGDDAGMHERIDCGCVWEQEVGSYPTLATARLVAMAKARRKGTWDGGRVYGGLWSVENADREIVSHN